MLKANGLKLPILLSAIILGCSGLPVLAQEMPQEMPPETPVPSEPVELAPPPPPIIDQTAPVAVSSGKGDILPVKSADEAGIIIDENATTDPVVKLTPDRSELIRLRRKPAAVILGNPAHLNILPEGENTLVLVPRTPGATFFTVLDEENNVIMQRHVLVAVAKDKYVRIRKSCGGTRNCQPTQVYYCPDMCHQIIGNEDTEQAAAVSSEEGGAVASAGSEDQEESPAQSDPEQTDTTDNSESAE